MDYKKELDMIKESIKDEIACLPKHSGTYREIDRLQALEWVLARFPEETADQIATLTAERDKLKIELAVLLDCCAVYKKATDGFNARLDKLLEVAEKERLDQKADSGLDKVE